MAKRKYSSIEANPPKKTPDNGVALAIESADQEKVLEDITSITLAYGTPLEQETMKRWAGYFDYFRVEKLNQDLNEPFDGKDTLMFMSCITMRSNEESTPTLSVHSIEAAWKCLNEYGVFKFDLTISEQAKMHFKCWTQKALSENRLYEGSPNDNDG